MPPPMTKYELATQLRELNRGMPRLPISTMKKHEIEANIDAIRKYKGIVAEEMEGRPANAKPGPLGPRPIKVEEDSVGDEEDNVIIRVPKAPAPRVSTKPKVTVPKVPTEPSGQKEPSAAKEPKSVVKKVEKVVESKKSGPVTTHFCNCPECPIKKKKTM